MRLLHLTDPHLSSLEGISLTQLTGKRWSGYLSWRRKRRWQHRRETLDRLSRAAAAEQADLTVVTGDLAHIGLESELLETGEWLQTLGPPERVLVIPGNHDIYARSSWRAAAAHWGPYLHLSNLDRADNRACYPGHFRIGEISIVSTSSALPTRVFSATGKLGAAQIERIEKVLKDGEGAGRFCCLLIHHPPLPGMIERRKALSDAEQLLPALERQRPDLILHGHNHRNTATQLGATRIYSTNSASSTVPARPASYRVFDIEQARGGWGITMQLKQLQAIDLDVQVTDTDQWFTPAENEVELAD